MTKTKLEIIGNYTPEHPGPYSFSGEECLVHATLGTRAFISRPESDLGFIVNTFDIRNAREVPVAREFWVNEYRGDPISYAWDNESLARTAGGARDDYLSTIHVREVLPGDGE